MDCVPVGVVPAKGDTTRVCAMNGPVVPGLHAELEAVLLVVVRACSPGSAGRW